ncbi:MAG: hypothetical protein FJZ67_10795 [Bacteroidetes bacterium]|nr:hypothetical protein [Bacteroidota bacterium]
MSFWDVLYYAFLIIGGVFLLLITLLAFLVGRGLERRDGPTGKAFTFHERIFYNVVKDLKAFARLFKVTYNEINIIVFYFFIPFTWMILVDYILDFHYLKIAFGVFCTAFYMLCRDFRSFSDRLYRKSVDFLNFFNRFGSSYIISSVWICIFIPVLIYGGHLYLIFK